MLKLLTIALLFSGMLATSEAKADIDTSRWMADLDQEALITRISIPGTHGRYIPDDIQDEEIDGDDRVFKLRAEHSGNGRVYTVAYNILDGCGTNKTVEATVTVPRDKGKNKRLKRFYYQ